LADALELVGDRWSLQLVAVLADGPRRFNELQAALSGIAPNVLTARLRHLEASGLLVARPYSERPPRLSYELTEDGHDLHDVLEALVSWDRRRRGAAAEEAGVHDLCGTPLRRAAVCPNCRVIVDDRAPDVLDERGGGPDTDSVVL
jgi:DNA-binding HxlR family transcriptional regulator